MKTCIDAKQGNPGAAVLPAGQPGTVSFQASDDLKTWQTLSAETYAATNANRFFRVTISPP